MINIAEILKDCPKGTKLYSPICGNCKLIKIYNGLGFDVINDTDAVFNFLYDGRYHLNGECCIFPSKENRDWNKFRPFKDGDILTYTGNHTTTFIYRNKDNEPHLSTSFYVACNNAPTHNFLIYNKYTLIALNENCDVRLATEDEKIKLFDAIKVNGYKWNAETKTLEKLIVPKFKVGDQIVKKNSISNSYIVNSVSCEYYGLLLPDKSGVGVLNVNEQDEWEVLFNITPKFKSGDKIVKKNDPTECWYVQGNIDSYCGSYHYNIVTKSKFANLYLKDQDDWELAPTPKFKVGDIVETKRNKLFDYKIIKITDTHYTLESIPGANTYDILICEDENWKLVPTHKFKVGDKIAYQDIVYSIVGIDGGYYSVKSIIGEIGLLPIFGENAYKLIPKKFDISTLKVYDKVLVRDDNNSTWVNAFFGFCDPVTVEKYPFVASAVNWAQCIPYEGNEHLLGTCDDCDEYYKNW